MPAVSQSIQAGVSLTASCFQYRMPRFPTRLPVEIHSDGYYVMGTCMNLSESGMLVQTDLPVFGDRLLLLRMQLHGWTVDFDVNISYTAGLQTGLRFLTVSRSQRFVVTLLMQLANEQW